MNHKYLRGETIIITYKIKQDDAQTSCVAQYVSHKCIKKSSCIPTYTSPHEFMHVSSHTDTHTQTPTPTHGHTHSNVAEFSKISQTNSVAST